jgi:nucleotide-binding universal stress UspA family protein
MFQLKRILFPVDFSERCRTASAYVEALAHDFNAELILLHVVEPPAYNASLADSHRSHSEGFDAFFGDRLKHLRVKRLIEHGEAASKIVQCAAHHQAGLIMIPTQGMGIYRRLIIGSTAAKVLHDADCPVWTGVHLENPPAPSKIHYEQICCAVDLKPHSARVLDWAHRVAELYKAELTLVHAGPQDSSVHALEDLQKTVGSHAALQVRNGEATEVVADLTLSLRADLLVIGRGAESGILGRLEANAYSIIRQSHCPVVSV